MSSGPWINKYVTISGIYEIINLVNGKSYIGSSVDIRKRKWEHLHALRKNKHINEVVINMAKFCREHNIPSNGNFIGFLTGRRKSCLGWRLVS